MRPALVYDGDCPFCAHYVGLTEIRKRYPDIELVNARTNQRHPAVLTAKRAGIKIDDGMALIIGDQVYYGAAAMRKVHWMPNWLYSILRAGRNVVLRVLGRTKLGF